VRPFSCSVLVVDDEPLVTATLAKLLGDQFEVVCVASGEAAVEVLKQRTVDLVLADQKMAGMTGVELLAWVKEHHPNTVRLLMSGLARFEDALEAINCGQVSRLLVKPWNREELLSICRDAARTVQLEKSHGELNQQLQNLNLQLEERVRQRTRELQEANHELQQKNWMLEKLALTDALTGLPNRRAMDRLARTELRRRQRFPNSMALALVDVDHFKEVNARYLLPGGDQVLIDLGRILAGSIRTIDHVGRIGGEEFEIVAPETNQEGAAILAERIRGTVEATAFHYKEETIRITVSVGFAVAEEGTPAEYAQMKHVAALALAEAKNTGRNRCLIYSVKDYPTAGLTMPSDDGQAEVGDDSAF
jgi:diguanylate cyclase (GGDEF)-like protein